MLSREDLAEKYWADDYLSWHANGEVPEALDREVVGKLLSKGWEQEYDAAAELYTRSLFEDLKGLKFEFHPELQANTPDFRLWTQFGKAVIADVRVLHNSPISHLERQQEDYVLLRQKAHVIATEHFATQILSISGTRSVAGVGGGPVAINKIIQKVRESIDELEQRFGETPSFLRWEQTFMGNIRSAKRRITFPELDISLDLDVAFYLKEDEQDDHLAFRELERQEEIGVASSFSDAPDRRLRDAIGEKTSYLEKVVHSQSAEDRLPYMVILFDVHSTDETDMEKVLYGPSIGYDLSPRFMNEDLYQWTLRCGPGSAVSHGEGLFTNRRKNFLAALNCTGDIRSPLNCEMAMWVNPYASLFRIPQSLFRLRTYSLTRRIDRTPPA